MGLIAATFDLCFMDEKGTEGPAAPFSPKREDEDRSSFDSRPGFDLSLEREEDHLGGLKVALSLICESFSCLLQKKRSRSASCLSKEATGVPWILAIPSVTKLW